MQIEQRAHVYQNHFAFHFRFEDSGANADLDGGYFNEIAGLCHFASPETFVIPGPKLILSLPRPRTGHSAANHLGKLSHIYRPHL